MGLDEVTCRERERAGGDGSSGLHSGHSSTGGPQKRKTQAVKRPRRESQRGRRKAKAGLGPKARGREIQVRNSASLLPQFPNLSSVLLERYPSAPQLSCSQWHCSHPTDQCQSAALLDLLGQPGTKWLKDAAWPGPCPSTAPRSSLDQGGG